MLHNACIPSSFQHLRMQSLPDMLDCCSRIPLPFSFGTVISQISKLCSLSTTCEPHCDLLLLSPAQTLLSWKHCRTNWRNGEVEPQ